MGAQNIYRFKSKILNKYIQFVLINSFDHELGIQKQKAYPNNNHCLSLLYEGKLKQINRKLYGIEKDVNNSSYWTGIYDCPMNKEIKQSLTEICINFQPGGFAFFSKEDLSPFIFIDQPIKNKLSKDWECIYDCFSYLPDHGKMLDYLEVFFLSRLLIPKNHFFFWKLQGNTIQELCHEMLVSYRSLHRIFKSRLGISPKKYLQIKKFRKVLDGLNDQPGNRLIQGYSDHSHLIRSFKLLAEETPLQFAKKANWLSHGVILA